MAHWTDKLLTSPGFCSRPFFHLYVGQQGGTNVCCNNTEYSYGNIKQSSFNEVYSKDNSKLVEFRKEFLDSDQLPDSCRACNDPARANYKNSHIQQTKRFLRRFDTPEDLINNQKIYTYDVRFNNLCNLMCVYCAPQASTRIAVKSYNDGRSDYVFESIDDKNLEQILDRFETSIKDVSEFYFAGGEPLIMKEHYNILDICIRHNKYDILLTYNSNLTKLGTKKYNALDYWKNFQKIGLNASIDAGWEQFEFIRNGGKWNQVVENLQAVRALSNVDVTITPTVAFWNMLHIPRVYKYLVENNLLSRQTHDFGGEIQRYEFLRPAVLPTSYKNYLRELYDTEYKDYPELKLVLRHLDEDLSHLLPKAREHVEQLAKKQNCDVYEIFPEFKDIFRDLS